MSLSSLCDLESVALETYILGNSLWITLYICSILMVLG